MRDNTPTARLEAPSTPEQDPSRAATPDQDHRAALAQLPQVTYVAPSPEAGHLTLELLGGGWVHLAPEHTARLALPPARRPVPALLICWDRPGCPIYAVPAHLVPALQACLAPSEVQP